MTASDPTGGRDDLQVSIVMPAFNEADILEGTVSDVVEGMRARNQPFEVIVCENGSTDGTPRCTVSPTSIPRSSSSIAPADYGAVLHEGAWPVAKRW